MILVRAIALGIVALTLSNGSFAQPARGTIREGLTVESKVLGRSVRYSIYLPPGYSESAQAYPVVYLLHGGGGSDSSWVEMEAGTTADDAIAAHEIPPLILVMPDAGTSRYVNSRDGSVRYEDFFLLEMIPAIESKYRVRQGRGKRAIAGFSMGGYATILYSLRHGDSFIAGAALSAAIYTDEMMLAMPQEQWDSTRGPSFGAGLEGSARFTAYYRKYDPLAIVREGIDPKRVPKLYLDCGDDDFRNEGNAALHVALRKAGVAHEYRVRNGAHTPTYWRTGLREALLFIGDVFRNPAP